MLLHLEVCQSVVEQFIETHVQPLLVDLSPTSIQRVEMRLTVMSVVSASRIEVATDGEIELHLTVYDSISMDLERYPDEISFDTWLELEVAFNDIP